MVREIITVQIGHYANEIGAHLWNQFDSEQSISTIDLKNQFYIYNNQNKSLPTARVIVIDRRNTFGWLLNSSSTNKKQILDDKSIEVIQRIDDVDEKNNQWSKILSTKARFHPRCLLPLRDHWQSNDSKDFDLYPIGQQTGREMFDQFEDSVHFQLEQCDHLQAFRCLFDCDDGFSGLFTSIQDYLMDECPKRPIWSFAVSNKSPSTLNYALTLTHSLNTNEMPTIPCLKSEDSFQQSLIIQHALLSSSSLTLDILADRLCPMKTSLLTLKSELPFDLHNKTLFSYLQDRDLLASNDPLACHSFIRGLNSTQLYNRATTSLHFESAADLLDAYFREQYGSKIYSSTYSWSESLIAQSDKLKFNGVSLMTLLINDREQSFRTIERLMNETKKLNYKLLSKRWEENGFDEQCLEQLNVDLDILHERYQSD